jgi:peptidoglycan/LPS O-acetylase OafA/YrhL
MIFGFVFPYMNYEFYAFLFAFIILNLAGNPNSIISLEIEILKYLGKISYGLYMYHPIAIVIVLKCIAPMFNYNNWVIHIFVIGLTIIISATSYQFFEKRFIELKIKYSKIISGDNIKE